MSDYQGGPGWWQATDGRWYPPDVPAAFTATGERVAPPSVRFVEEPEVWDEPGPGGRWLWAGVAFGVVLAVGVLAIVIVALIGANRDHQRSAAASRSGSGSTVARGQGTGATGAGAGGTGGTAAGKDETALARQMLATLADFPPGWTADAAPTDKGNGSSNCGGQSFQREGLTGRATGPALRGPASSPTAIDFTGGTTLASVFVDARAAQAAVTRFAGNDFRTCLQSNLGAAPTGTTATVDVATLPFSTLGDGTSAVRAHYSIAGAPVKIDFYIDIVLVAQGRAAVGVVLYRSSSPPDAAIEQQVLVKAVGRATAALR